MQWNKFRLSGKSTIEWTNKAMKFYSEWLMKNETEIEDKFWMTAAGANNWAGLNKLERKNERIAN